MEATGGKPHLLKLMNQSTVLEVVRKFGRISRADVARMTGLSRPTVSQAVSGLLAAGLVCEVGEGEAAVGRKPVMLTFNPNAAAVAGVFVGATHIFLALTNLDGEIQVERQLLTPVADGPQGIANAVIHGITQLVESAGIDPARVCGIGVGVTGAVDTKSGVVVEASGLGVNGWPLRTILEDRFGLPVFVDNDVNILLAGEQWKGAVVGRQNALCFSLGTGIGGALLIGGKIHRGSHSLAGEVGATLFDRRLLAKSHLGGYGPLEAAVSGTGLIRYTLERLAAGTQSCLQPYLEPGAALSVEQIFAAARQGDQLANQVVLWLAEHLALLIGNACLLVDPEVIVLTGRLAGGADLFVPPMLSAMRNFVTCMPEVKVSQIGVKAGIFGAVQGVLALGRSSISFHGGESVLTMGTR